MSGLLMITTPTPQLAGRVSQFHMSLNDSCGGNWHPEPAMTPDPGRGIGH